MDIPRDSLVFNLFNGIGWYSMVFVGICLYLMVFYGNEWYLTVFGGILRDS